MSVELPEIIEDGRSYCVLATLAATLELSRDAKIVLWLAYLAFFYGLAIYYGLAIHEIRRKSRYRMTFLLVLSGGLLLGAVASVITWCAFPLPPEK